MDNPFTELLSQIENKVRKNRQLPSDDLLIVCAVQLKLLKTLYRSMLESSMRSFTHIESAEDYEDHSYRSNKSIFDYFQFINVLNQLGRILKKRGVRIPKLNRIKFFRDKAAEHWGDYTIYGIAGSQYQSPGEAAIPSTSTTYTPEDRRELKKEIDDMLQSFGLTLKLDSPEVSNTADINREKIYSVLEKIDPSLRKIPDRLVELLFKFGFPAPIDKVTEYSRELVSFLDNVLMQKIAGYKLNLFLYELIVFRPPELMTAGAIG